MRHHPYEATAAKALLPLLDSIRRELEERGETLARIEERIDSLAHGPCSREAEQRFLLAEASAERRELRRCHRELERLGCSVLGTKPLTIRIPTVEGATKKSLVWQHGRDPHA